MTIKYSKSIAIAGVLALSALMVAPSQAADPVVPTTGIIHVLSRVINDNLGTKYPTDFVFNLKHWGADVAGSPFIGTGAAGTTFVVEPGTYVVSTPIVEGYTGTWFNGTITNGFINLAAGDEVTIVRIHDDAGVAEEVVVVEPTEDGGTLPNTSSPWFNALAAGLLISAAGALGVRKSKSFN
jgi:LPXTG-motif cell wall-anchored protein